VHELSLARQIVRRACDEAARQGAERVSLLRIALGPEGGYQPEPLAFSIEAAALRTAVEGAELAITPVESGGVVLNEVELEFGEE
jgi:Zn finger protein HypA/HybF involved in hydrogenase expression